MKKSKQEMISEMAELAKKHEQKKEVIGKIFKDLDAEDKMSNKHMEGIAAVNELLKEMEDLEIQHSKLMTEIKN
jgi:hypothetical protein